MIFNFISKFSTANYNIKLAKLLGLYSSIYLNLLIDQSVLGNLIDGFIKLSREEIYNLSGIEESKQLEVEENLQAYNLIQISKVKNSTSKNYYKLNEELICKLLMHDLKEVELELSKTFVNFKKATKPPNNVSKRASIISNLKNNISTTDSTAKQYLEDWVDAIYQKSGYLSKQAVTFMEEQLLSYSHNKITLFRDLCRLAARVAYKDPKWVITKYQEEKGNNLQLNTLDQNEIDENLQKLKEYKGESF